MNADSPTRFSLGRSAHVSPTNSPPRAAPTFDGQPQAGAAGIGRADLGGGTSWHPLDAHAHIDESLNQQWSSRNQPSAYSALGGPLLHNITFNGGGMGVANTALQRHGVGASTPFGGAPSFAHSSLVAPPSADETFGRRLPRSDQLNYSNGGGGASMSLFARGGADSMFMPADDAAPDWSAMSAIYISDSTAAATATIPAAAASVRQDGVSSNQPVSRGSTGDPLVYHQFGASNIGHYDDNAYANAYGSRNNSSDMRSSGSSSATTAWNAASAPPPPPPPSITFINTDDGGRGGPPEPFAPTRSSGRRKHAQSKRGGADDAGDDDAVAAEPQRGSRGRGRGSRGGSKAAAAASAAASSSVAFDSHAFQNRGSAADNGDPAGSHDHAESSSVAAAAGHDALDLDDLWSDGNQQRRGGPRSDVIEMDFENDDEEDDDDDDDDDGDLLPSEYAQSSSRPRSSSAGAAGRGRGGGNRGGRGGSRGGRGVSGGGGDGPSAHATSATGNNRSALTAEDKRMKRCVHVVFSFAAWRG